MKYKVLWNVSFLCLGFKYNFYATKAVIDMNFDTFTSHWKQESGINNEATQNTDVFIWKIYFVQSHCIDLNCQYLPNSKFVA